MCWSGPASLAVASVGVGGSLWARSKGVPDARWRTLLYFTGMELLQAVTYIVIDQCGLPSNIWLTRLSYAHIAFQPFFINLLGLSFVPKEIAARVKPYVLAACALGASIMLAKMFVPSPSMACDPATLPLCGADTCSYHGSWHIAWRLYLSTLDNTYLSYFLPAFIVPLFYGSWRWVVYHMLVGPVPAFFMSPNKDEVPAIWCLMSIGFLLALHLKPIEHWMESPLRHPALGRAADYRRWAQTFGGACAFVVLYLAVKFAGGVEVRELAPLYWVVGLSAPLAAWFYVRSDREKRAGLAT